MTTVVRPIHFVRRGRRTKAVSVPDPAPEALPNRVPRVARLMALAIHFDGMLRKGVVADQSELARICDVTQPRITQIMNLLHLAPDIQEELLFMPATVDGRDLIHEHMLRSITRVAGWNTQRHQWRKMQTVITRQRESLASSSPRDESLCACRGSLQTSPAADSVAG